MRSSVTRSAASAHLYDRTNIDISRRFRRFAAPANGQLASYIHLGGKVGVILEATAVEPRGRISHADLRAVAAAQSPDGTEPRELLLGIDEANLAEYVTAGWVYPLADVVPADYDIADFRVDLSNVASSGGVQYFAPFVGGGDVMMYRKDILEAKGLPVPKTLDELVASIKAVNDPANKLYGWSARGQRGANAQPAGCVDGGGGSPGIPLSRCCPSPYRRGVPFSAPSGKGHCCGPRVSSNV